jgi:hypothetical protein
MSRSHSAAWTPADFYHNAQEIRRCLQLWHVDDGLSPTHWATLYQSKGWERKTFNSILFRGGHGPRPSAGIQVYPGLPPPEGQGKGYVGSAFPNNDCLTDRSLTQWYLREYADQLKRVRKQSEPWRLLRLAFDRLLQEPIYHVRVPDERDGPVDCHPARCQQQENPNDPSVFKVLGRRIDGELLDSFVEAAKIAFEPSVGQGAPPAPPAVRPPAEERTETKKPQPPSLDGEEVIILRTLSDAAPQLCNNYYLEAKCTISRKTVGDRLRRLIELGLAHRPKGARKGTTITLQGAELLVKLPPPKDAQKTR